MSEGPRTGLATEVIAKKIIELARESERDTVSLQDRAQLKLFRGRIAHHRERLLGELVFGRLRGTLPRHIG
jgi:hypothetical protein